MEEQERSRSRSPRRASRVEQVVGKWLRRSRDSLSRERILGGRKGDRSRGSSQQNFPVKVTVEVIRDSVLDSHGFSLTTQHPLLVRDVTAGGPADGKLLPGDQVLKVNSKATEDLQPEHVAEMIRECTDSVTMTILRQMSNPKSSFMSAEKRARLKRNPVKVRFAEEVVVNGHTQGNSLLFLPNVLKVYLENGQTKAFKFDSSTTVKDIVLTLKEKLSIHSIEYFSLVLEQQYSITKLLLLHEDEHIQKVVQKKDSHDYRCLFRVCFIPREPMELMQDDPVTFEYLFHQSVGDVLQERFAVEMKCNTALRLAALHMHERLASCGQPHRASVKSMAKEFGLESFISPTLLRNMREKDLRKALGYHLKKIQSLLEPHQKVISVSQARLAYLTQMAELISYSGRSYNATMLLQDRETLVSLLVGARYGLSQVLNHKINMISTIIDFHYITRVELLSESDRVSMMKIYLQDIHPLALLMDSVAAKDLACLLAGYCKLLVDPNTNVFHWGPRPKMRRIPADYGRRCGSDSEETSEEDYSMEGLLDTQLSEDTLSTRSNDGLEDEEEEEQEMDILKKRGKEVVRREGRVRVIVTQADDGDMQEEDQKGDVNKNSVDAEEYGAGMDSLLQTGWYTDPRVNSSFSSLSSNSLNALEESNKAKPAPMEPVEEERQQSGSAKGLHCLDVHHPYLLDLPEQLQRNGERKNPMRPSDLAYSKHTDLCFAELSQMSDYLPSPPEASDDALSDDEENDGGDSLISSLSPDLQVVLASCNSNTVHSKVPGITVHALLARIRSHPACRQESRRNRRELETHGDTKSMAETPPPAPLRRAGPFQALNLDADARDSGSESEEEFFDAQDRLTPPVTEQNLKVNHKDVISEVPASKVRDVKISVEETAAHELEKSKEDYSKGDTNSLPNALPNGNNLNHDISIITTDHTHEGTKSTDEDHAVAESPSTLTPPRTPLQIKPVLDHHTTEQKGLQAHGHNQCNGDIPGRNSRLSSELLEMEPDTMEFKPVTSAGPPLSSPLITAVRQTRSQPKVTAVMGTLENKHTQKKGEPEDLPQKGPHLGDVTTTTPKETLKEQEDRRIEHVKSLEELKKQQSLPSHQLENGENKMSSLSVSLTPISTPLTPTSQASTDLEVTPKTEHKRNIPPNGLTVHSWHQRNGNTSPVFSKGVSLSQENLRSENPDSDVMVTSASTTPTPSPSPSVAVRGSITGDPKELVGTQGFSNRNSSSGRLSASALRGRIQDLPWYLTRSQEILGTIVLSSGDGSTESKAANTTDERQEPTKVSPKATSVPTLYAGKEEDAEVVIVKLKDGPQEGTSLLKEANGDLKAPPEMRRSESRDSSDMYRHLGTCQLDQPQSHRDSPEESGQGGPSSSSSDAQPHREACGCRTVYANCFSGDSEDVCSFDDEMTVYEFSQRKQVNKPPQIPPAPSPLSLPMPSSNVLSLLRDSPRPLSCSTELSPLLTPPRPLEPRPPELGPQDDPLHSLKGKRYMMGQRGTGLKEAYASLHQDIDKLLTVLRNTSPAVTLPSNKEYCEKCKEANGNSLSETERCLLQAEARRLASGCQRATRVGWAPDDALFSLGNSFGALVHLASACLRVPCAGCGGCHGNIDGGEALGKIQEIVKLYKEFVVAVETAKEGEGVRLLAKQCTVLISTVFSLTQLFRTRTPDIDNGNVPLIF